MFWIKIGTKLGSKQLCVLDEKEHNTFAAKHLKKPTPQCQACFKDSCILWVYGFNTE